MGNQGNNSGVVLFIHSQDVCSEVSSRTVFQAGKGKLVEEIKNQLPALGAGLLDRGLN